MVNQDEHSYRQLQSNLRKKILELHFRATAGHIGSSLSCLDILIATLVLNTAEHDSFILSKGHAATALYACLNYLGEITDEELVSYYKNGTQLPAHPAPLKFRGIPFATGSLGHGFPVGAGIAKANKLSGSTGTVFVVLSDGETNAGTTWEAAHFSIKNELDNLIIFIDNNGLQGFGTLPEVLGNSAQKEKWEALGFDVDAGDGHDVGLLGRRIVQMKQNKNGKPKVFIAKTTKGKGVSYMEDTLAWHYMPMTEELYRTALHDIAQDLE